MATETLNRPAGTSAADQPLLFSEQVRAVLKPLASLKLTVVLFSLAIVVVFIGSLAQGQKDVWLVVRQYFRTGIAWIDLKDCFPPAFFPHLLDYNWDGLPVRHIPFPGGWAIGAVMAVNLLAAHIIRFRIQARGSQLWSGLGLIGIGAVATVLVVSTGMSSDGFQTEPWLEYKTIWQLLLGGMGLAAIALMGFAFRLESDRKVERGVFIGAGIAALALIGWLMTQESMGQMSDASMRILWQLMKAEFASLILLAGCALLFGKRGGVVLLHAGVGVLMFSELLVGLTVSENRFQLFEGETSNFVFDLRERELVLIDNTHETPRVVSIPEAMIEGAAGTTNLISDEKLPFDIEVLEFVRHSRLRKRRPEDESPANRGTGVDYVIEERPAATGMQSRTDASSAYIRIREKQSSRDLGTYLVGMALGDQPEIVVHDGHVFDMSLRFKRTYKPYTVKLLDVRKDDYLGTSTPQNYSSDIELVDKERGVERKLRIWMNNPLRYAGETLYQTDYYLDEDTGEEMTSLQVVNNRGWMLPYMACMIVGTGLAAQFLITLSRFLRRRAQEGPYVLNDSAEGRPYYATALIAAPIAISLFGGLYLASKAMPPRFDKDEFNLYEFGRITVAKGGRQQPLDSVARNRMRVLTNGKSQFEVELTPKELAKDWDDISEDIAGVIPSLEQSDLKSFEGGVPELVDFIVARSRMDEPEVRARIHDIVTQDASATRWLLDVTTRQPTAPDHRVFRIDEPQLLSVLDLQPREGAKYSLREVLEHFPELETQVDEAAELMRVEETRLTRFQRRLLKLAGAVRRVTILGDVFGSYDFDVKEPYDSCVRAVSMKRTLDQMGQMSDSSLVLCVPVGKTWDSLALASIKQGILEYAQTHKCQSVASLTEQLVSQLPQESVLGGLETAIRALEARAANGEDGARSTRAMQVITTLGGEDQFLRSILLAVGEADDDATAREIYDGLSEERRERLYDLSRATTITRLAEIVSAKSRKRLSDLVAAGGAPTSESLDQLIGEFTVEALGKILTDEEVAAGPNPATKRMQDILQAWSAKDPARFNELTKEHNDYLASLTPVESKKTGFEAWFNHSAPSYYSTFLYLFAFVLSCVALLGWPRLFNRSAFVLIALVFVVHTLALMARIYISGRPPVTNLYSSAVFIGWACVLFGLIFERIMRNGIGNVVSSVAGASTLGIAYLLGHGGDTFEVLQAVLDTQFWLSTHVVCITLGYATTFLAGLLGIIYIFLGVCSTALNPTLSRLLARMVYGTICFAVLFSFIGTVLGGLWADDSWGRFWGWDPKENGALIIVIWNAIVLHARWDGMVKERGMAVLAVAGNICTAWSWFGVNELRAGLHAYGFTEGRLFALMMFILSQMIVLVIGTLPKDYWRSFRARESKQVA